MIDEMKNEDSKRGPIAWMARNRVAANIVMVVLIGGGLMWCMQIKQEIFPDFDLDIVTVTVAYPGASPDEIEKGVVLPIEEQLSGLDGMDEISSVSGEGYGMVSVEMQIGYDKQKFLQDIKNEVDRITTFPDDAEEPKVSLASHSRGVLMVVVHGKIEAAQGVEKDIVNISVSYPGASPDEVEVAVLKPVEARLSGIEGIREFTGTAREELGVVSVEMEPGRDRQKFLQDIKNEIGRMEELPADAGKPEVRLESSDSGALAAKNTSAERLLRGLAEKMRERLLQSPGITKVELRGVRPHEVIVEVKQEDLRRYGLTLGGIANTIRLNSVEIPGGGIDTESGEVLVRVKRRRYWAAEFEDIAVKNPHGGEPLCLSEIANTIDGFEDDDFSAQYNDEPAVLIEVMRVGDQTPIEVSAAAHEIIAGMNEQFPPGIEAVVLNDFSELYSQRMSLLLRNAYIGLALVFVLLAVFLEARLAFWIAMGIPISFLGAFLFLPAMDVSVNMLSMFAFIVALGIVVDDAIVVGENIYRWKQKGLSFQKAAVRGAREVAMPVTFSILTNIAAFMPMLFIPGAMGKIWAVIPAVVITVFLISLFESLFILPAHLGHYREKRRRGVSAWLHHRQQNFSHAFVRFVQNRYKPFLALVARNRYVAISVAAAILMLTLGWVASGRMGMTAMPKVESDVSLVTIKLPYGSPVESVEAVRDGILANAKEIIAENGGEKLVEGIFTMIGAEGSHVCTIMVFMRDPKTRPISTTEFTNEWREASGRPGGLESLEFSADSFGPRAGKSISVQLIHSDIKVLEAAAADLAETLKRFSVVRDIDDGFSLGKEQLDFTMLPAGISEGLTHMEIARQMRYAYQGVEAFKQQRGRNEVTVRVRLTKEEREREQSLDNFILRTPSGGEIRLMDAAEYKRGRSYTEIKRRSGRRVITVVADADPPRESSVVLDAIETEILPGLMEKHPGLQYSFEGEEASINESMESIYAGLVVAALAIYAMLAIPMRSYAQPAIIMVSIPFGVVGAVLGHLIMGFGLSVISVLGIVALSGVVVNDSLVFIDFANRERRSGKSAYDSILSAGANRFRPIMLTTLTTFGGLAPMIFETSLQARFMIPMAVSLGYGIMFATGITLLLVPSLYLVIDDMKLVFGRMRSHVRAFFGGPGNAWRQ